ncbi:MAG: tetratricopeptide repeat protein [Candidatus Omnitrophota bacterium]
MKTLRWRMIVPCLGILFLAALGVDREQALMNCINYEKNVVEPYLMRFETRKAAYDARMFRLAVHYYSWLTRLSPESALLHGSLGFCHYYQKEYDQALASYDHAIQFDPLNYSLCWDQGMILYEKGQYSEAVKRFNKSLRLMGELMPSIMAAESVLNANGETTLSQLLQRVISRARYDEERLLYALVKCYYQLGQYPFVKRVAMMGLENYPQSPGFLYYAALAHYLNKDYVQAAQYFSKTILSDSENMEAYYYRGLCWKELGQEQSAARDYAIMTFMREKGMQPKKYYAEELRLHLNQDLMLFIMNYHKKNGVS